MNLPKAILIFCVSFFAFAGTAGAATLHCELNPETIDTSHGQLDLPITRLYVSKKTRTLFAMNAGQVLKSYHISLGRNGDQGPKHFENDFKTPEGRYFLTEVNDQSSYHLGFRLSYPDAADVDYAQSQNQKPGGNIELHGFPDPAVPDYPDATNPFPSLWDRAQSTHQVSADWTAGCIAVTSDEIDELATQLRPTLEKRKPVTIDLCP